MSLYRWNNTSGGDLLTGTNWDVGGVPGPLDDALIGLSGTYQIEATGVFSFQSLEIDPNNVTLTYNASGSASQVGGDLTNAGAINVDNDFDDGGSAVTVAGTLTNIGQLELGARFNTLSADDSITAAHIVNTGSIILAGATGATAPRSVIEDTGDTAPVTLDGTLALTGHAQFDYGAGGHITAIGSDGSLTLGSADARVTAAGDDRGNTALDGLASNAGQLTLTGAVVTAAVNEDFINTGKFSVGNGGSIGTRRDITNSDTFQVDPNLYAGGTAVTVTGTLTNSKQLTLGAAFNTLSADDSITATHIVNTGNILVQGAIGATAPRSVIEDTGDTAPVTLDGSLALTGHAQFDYGASGHITAIGSDGSLTLGSADARVTTAGDDSGNTALDGLASNAGQLTLTGAVLTAAMDADFTNTGMLSLGNGGSIGTRRNVINSKNLYIAQDPSDSGTAVTLTGTLTNSGQLTLGAAFNNVYANASITAANIVNTGSITVVTGATLSVTRPAPYAQTGGTTQIDGTLAGSVVVSGGVLDGTGSVTGSVSNTGGIVRAGDQPDTPGLLTVMGSYAQSGSGVLEEDLAGATAAGEILVTGGTAALNSGTLQIYSENGFTPMPGQSFLVLAALPGQLSGRFSMLRYGTTLGNGSYVSVGNGVYLTIAYDDAAGTVTLETVATPPVQTAVPEVSPTKIAIGNVHLGDTGTQALTVTNADVQPADSLDASVAGTTGGVLATGAVSGLTPATSDATHISVGIDTSTVGVKDGQATIAFLSDSGGGVVAPLSSQSVAVTGSVFRLASAAITPVNAVVHVGNPGTFALSIRNADPADGFSETLNARITGTSGSVASTGASAVTLAPGGSSGTTFLVTAATNSVGTSSGAVSLALGSDGGTGAGSVDGLGVTTLASQTVGVSVTVDNYAVPSFTLRDADGLAAVIAGSATAETLDLGTIARDSGPLVLGLGVTNTAAGPADLLAGTILASGSGGFTTAGLGAFAGLGAGQTDAAPTVTLDTSADGTFTETLSVDGIGSNASGYSGALARRTLTITGTVADLPAPTITGLGSLAAMAGVATSLGAISISDADADGIFIVTVTAMDGALSAAVLQGVTEQGAGSQTLTLTGSLPAVNAALASLAYTGLGSGSDEVIVSLQDAHLASASASETVVVTPMQSTPTVVNLPPQVTLEVSATPTALSGISISNPSAQTSGKLISFEIASSSGLILNETGNSGAEISGQGTAKLTLVGTVDQINADLADPIITDLAGAELDFIDAYRAPFEIISAALQGDSNPVPSNEPTELAVDLLTNTASLFQAIISTSQEADIAELLGDAHIASFGRDLLTFNTIGEYILAHSVQSGDSFEVQARLEPANDSPAGSIITQLAAQLGSDRITIDSTRAVAVFVNGVAYTLTTGGTISLSGGQIAEVADGSYQVTWNSGEVLTANIVGRHVDMAFGLGAGDAPGSVFGLAGRNDNPGTNYVLPDGTVLPDTLTSDQLYNTLGNAWRVTDATTLFDYDAGKTTASYTDTSFPRVQLALSDLPAGVVAKAAAAAAAAGVTDPNAMLVGEEDYILTGDPSFLAGAESAIRGSSLTVATITPSASAPAVLGVIADMTTVVTALDGSAQAIFDVYLTKPSNTDTIVSYAVVFAVAGDLDPAAFGTAPTSGSITIVAGQTTGQVTIAVPAGALGSNTSEPLALRIASTAVPVYAPDAQTELVEPVAGPPPVVSISEQTTLGTLTHSGNTYSLDVGAISYGESLPLIRFAIGNTAGAGADQLGGNLTVAPSYGFTVAGVGALSPIVAGQNYTGLTVALNENKFGANSETITFNPTDSNPSGYSSPLDPITLNISYTLEAPTMAYSQAWGDVHIITYNNLKYDFQAVGEFVLAHSNIAGDNFDIQLRLAPYNGSSSVSVITEVALQIGADRVTFGLDRATTVWLNGVPSTVGATSPTLNLAGGSVTMLSDATFKVTWTTRETATITDNGTFFNVIDGVPTATFGAFSGLQGEDEGQANDFQLADGTVLPQPLTESMLYGEYANTWRVSQATSLFDYAPGETTDTYTDRTFPHAPVELATLPADVQARALAAVASAGITDPAIAAAAELDYIATSDPRFIAAAAVAQQQAISTNEAVVTHDLPPVAQLGINADAASLLEAAASSTNVTFTVLLTQAAAADTVVNYAVTAPDNSYLGASAFGGTFPAGQVTIAAGQMTAEVTVAVPQGALGLSPTAGLEVDVSATDGTPVFAPSARTTIVNAQPEPGIAAAATFLNLADGTFTQSGNSYTLDLGMLAKGQLSPTINLAVGNTTVAPADSLSGSFTPPLGNGFIVIGNNLPAALLPGTMYSGIYAQANTSTLGVHSETLTFKPLDINPSGYQQALPTLSLTITDMVVAAAGASLLTPSTIVFQNVRVGTSENQAISIANTAPAGGAALAVTPSVSGNATATGSITSLAAGSVDASSIRVGLDTSAAGMRGGSISLNSASVLVGSNLALADQPSVAVFGSVYRPASATVAPIQAVLHVGDPGKMALTVGNVALADGFSESLIASLEGTTGDLVPGVTGPTSEIAAGSNSSILTLALPTNKAAVVTGTATVNLTSSGGTGTSSIDGLGQLALPSQTVSVSISIDNYAQAAFEKLSGVGSFSGSNGTYLLDFGAVMRGTSVTAGLGVLNSAPGMADLLSGMFTLGAGDGIAIDGLDTFTGLGAGQADTALSATLDTSKTGRFTRTVNLVASGSNASGYSGALAPETLTITGAVVDQTQLVLNAPTAITAQTGVPINVTGLSLSATSDIAGDATVTLSDGFGLLAASNTTGATISGSGTTQLSVSGTLAQVNAALATVTDLDAGLAPDTITISASSLGLTTMSAALLVGHTFTLTKTPDTVAGGPGPDRIVAAGDTLGAQDSIAGGGGNDTLALTGAGRFDLRAPSTLSAIGTITATEGQPAYGVTAARNQVVTLRDGMDAPVVVAPDPASVPSNPRASTITFVGAHNAASITLGSGNDVVTVGDARETVTGGGGDNRFIVDGSTIAAHLDGGTGATTLNLTGGGTAVMGASITRVSSVLLLAAATPYDFTANATTGLTVTDANAGADTIRAGGPGQVLSGGGAGSTSFVGALSGGDIFANPYSQFDGDNIANFLAPGDLIDVAGLQDNSSFNLTFAQGSTAGTLAVSDGVHNAAIKLYGQFDPTGFAHASDGAGGTSITYTAR